MGNNSVQLQSHGLHKQFLPCISFSCFDLVAFSLSLFSFMFEMQSNGLACLDCSLYIGFYMKGVK